VRSAIGWLTLGLWGCYYASSPAGDDDMAPPSPGDPGGGTSDELPCEAAELLAAHCWSCHADPPRGGAPMPLVTLDDLSATAPAGQRFADRAITRMRDATRPMPPAGLPRPSAQAIGDFEQWVAAGLPPGECGTTEPPDPNDPNQPPPAETTCSSGTFWPTRWDDGSPDMNPGLPCRGCHLVDKPSRAYFFMGTAFPTLHEQDRCNSIVPPGTRVEIIDRNGAVALTLPVRAKGNFMSYARDAEVALPFTARVVTADGRVSQMMTPQMTGDCNACHTEQGANGAPGRIMIPQ
jgi:mono/diheme cytochrome c family protein